MKALIVGGSGLVGGNCLKYFKLQEEEVLATHYSFSTEETSYFDTLHLENEENVDIKEFNPDVIIHCGALTHVDYCEDHIEESHQKTVQSTQNMLKVAKELNAKFVYISSDYVFDGAEGPYDENAKINPKSVYGKHKLEAENEVIDSGLDYLILRITNVYGKEHRDKNFVARLVKNIQKGTSFELKLPSDQYATPVNAYDLARAIYRLLKAKESGIFHISSTDYYNRCQLAECILKYFPERKNDIEIEAFKTSELNQKAARPLQGGLKTGKFLSLFPDFVFTNVDDFLKEYR